MSQTRVFSVSEISRVIKELLEENIPTLWLQGEISNFKAHFSGHYYFTLKDENAQISAVMWKSRTFELDFMPEDGMLVQVLGNVRVYEKGGRYQIDVLRMQPAGLGALQMAFEQLKQKLQQEGLFDESAKKQIPAYPHKIGIVTSETGAALQDIINILSRRAPYVQIIVNPVKVQGEGAALEIARAIEDFNDYGAVDVLIVGRGGGSLEDLWAFNEEVVARAIYASHIPVISAVGHEIDFTIADFAADLRAPTPSAAAELAVSDSAELRQRVNNAMRFIVHRLMEKISYLKEKIKDMERSYGLRRPQDLIKQSAMNLDELHNKLETAAKNLVSVKKEFIHQLDLRLKSLNPANVLERGYSITYIDGKVVSDIDMVDSEMELTTEIKNGKIYSMVDKKEKREAP